jgi:hypothetical protein
MYNKQEKQMKTTFYTLLSYAVIGLTVPAYAGMPYHTPGGQIEYNFFTKFTEQEAKEVAEVLARATEAGRAVVLTHLPRILDPKIGDKGIRPDNFEELLRNILAAAIPKLTPVQKEMLDKYMKASGMVIAYNQDRLNVKGVGFKYVLPATWAKETNMIFRAMTGIPIKQSGPFYRIPTGIPDAFEKEVIAKFGKKDYSKQPYGEFGTIGTIGKQKVYRQVIPVVANIPLCLKCHGDDKGSLDILGYEKEGLKLNDLRGIISVAVSIKE